MRIPGRSAMALLLLAGATLAAQTTDLSLGEVVKRQAKPAKKAARKFTDDDFPKRMPVEAPKANADETPAADGRPATAGVAASDKAPMTVAEMDEAVNSQEKTILRLEQALKDVDDADPQKQALAAALGRAQTLLDVYHQQRQATERMGQKAEAVTDTEKATEKP